MCIYKNLGIKFHEYVFNCFWHLLRENTVFLVFEDSLELKREERPVWEASSPIMYEAASN